MSSAARRKGTAAPRQQAGCARATAVGSTQEPGARTQQVDQAGGRGEGIGDDPVVGQRERGAELATGGGDKDVSAQRARAVERRQARETGAIRLDGDAEDDGGVEGVVHVLHNGQDARGVI
jgi:hypothetical protein